MPVKARSLNMPREGKTILRSIAPRRNANRIGVSTQDGIMIVFISDILYCEAMGNYCRIHQRDGKPVVVSKPLKRLIALLPSTEFIRTHQSYLTRIDEITAIGCKVTLRNGIEIPISRNQRSIVMTQMKELIPVL